MKNMKKILSMGLIMNGVVSLGVSAGTLESDLDSLMQSRYGEDEPGAAVLILKGDEVLFERYYGIADMETREPIGPLTTFNIASVSKQFTVIGALALQQRGVFNINDTVAEYFPEWQSDIWKRVTFKHLASHTSGVPDSRDRSSREACVYADDSVSMSYIPRLTELSFEPGTYYDYINPTFIIMANVIERIVKMPFVEYQQQNIFDRCRMSKTYYFDPKAVIPHQSHAYVLDDSGEWKQYDYGEETFFATRPDGGIYSTARDMAKWEKALREGVVLNQHLLARAYNPVISVADSPLCDYQRRPNTYYALGWFVDKTPGFPTKVYHTGDNGGYQAYVAKYPSYDISIIVLENRNDNDRWSMALDIDKILKKEGLLGD